MATLDLPDPFFELSRETELVGEGTEPLELREREPAAFRPVHGAVHAEVAVVAPDCPSRLSRIELYGVESLAGDVAFR